jgi:hypothetical protein
MTRFIEGKDPRQMLLLPKCFHDYITADNTVRVMDAFSGELHLLALGLPARSPPPQDGPAIIRLLI